MMSFLAELLAVPAPHRDAWIDARLGFEVPPPDEPLPRGAVPYWPCGIAEILTMLAEAPVERTDELVDIGAGLGRVAIVAHLATGARAHGIELQPTLVTLARPRCVALGLPVTFTCGDAADPDVALDGSRFFLYAPCNGALLSRVLARLEAISRHRPIVVGAVHLELDVPWLAARPSTLTSLTLYDSAP